MELLIDSQISTAAQQKLYDFLSWILRIDFKMKQFEMK